MSTVSNEILEPHFGILQLDYTLRGTMLRETTALRAMTEVPLVLALLPTGHFLLNFRA